MTGRHCSLVDFRCLQNVSDRLSSNLFVTIMPPCLTRIGCSSHADSGALSQPYTFGHVVISRLSQSLTLGMALVMSALQKVSGCNRLEFI